MVSKTTRHNRVKRDQLRRRMLKAEKAGNWTLWSELETKLHMVLRRLGRNY